MSSAVINSKSKNFYRAIKSNLYEVLAVPELLSNVNVQRLLKVKPLKWSIFEACEIAILLNKEKFKAIRKNYSYPA